MGHLARRITRALLDLLLPEQRVEFARNINVSCKHLASLELLRALSSLLRFVLPDEALFAEQFGFCLGLALHHGFDGVQWRRLLLFTCISHGRRYSLVLQAFMRNSRHYMGQHLVDGLPRTLTEVFGLRHCLAVVDAVVGYLGRGTVSELGCGSAQAAVPVAQATLNVDRALLTDIRVGAHIIRKSLVHDARCMVRRGFLLFGLHVDGLTAPCPLRHELGNFDGAQRVLGLG